MNRGLIATATLILGFIPIVVISQPKPQISGLVIITWIVCIGVLLIADLLAGPLENGLWAGYLHLIITAMWLIWGRGIALTLTIIGVTISLALRLRDYHLPGIIPVKGYDAWSLWAKRVIVLSTVILFGESIYNLLRGEVPLKSSNINIPSLAITLAISWFFTQLLSYLLSDQQVTFIWQRGKRHRIINEFLLLFVTPPLVLIYDTSGETVFAVLLGLITAQSVRYRQITVTQQQLKQHIQELSLLNQVGQQVSSTLEIEDILKRIHDWLKQFADISVFYVALYDEQREQLRFPLVIQHGRRVTWADCQTIEHPHIHEVITSRKTIQVTPDAKYVGYLGIPLMVSNKLLGVMGIEDHNQLLSKLDITTLETVANQTSLALRNAILYDRTHQLADKLAHINQSVQDIMFNLDISHAMQVACQTAIYVASADCAGLYLKQTDDLKLVVSVNLPESLKAAMNNTELPMMNQLEQVILAESSTSPWETVILAAGFKMVTVIPLRSGNLPVGMLMLFNQQVQYYHDTELELLEAIGYQLAAALDNAELLNALEVYAAEQAQLVHLSRILTASLDTQTIIANVSKLLKHMIVVDSVWVGLLVEDTNYLQMYQADVNQKAAMLVSELPEIAQTQMQQHPLPTVYHRDMPTLSTELKAWMQHNYIQTLVICAMQVMDEWHGVILLGHYQKHHLAESSLRLLEMASYQISTQLYNAQLYEKIQHDLDHRLQQLTVIENLAQQISSALDFDSLIQHVLHAALRSTNANLALIGLYDEDNAYRVIWLKDDMLEEMVMPSPVGFMAQVMNSAEPVIIQDTCVIPDYEPIIETYLSVMAIPLKREKQIIGVLALQSDVPNFFTQDQSAFISNLAGHAVISIQNAQLLANRQAQIEALTILRDLSVRLSSNPHISSVIQGILRTGVDLVDARAAQLYQNRGTWQLVDTLSADDESDSVPEFILDSVYQTGQSYVVYDVQRDERLRSASYRGLIAVLIAHADVVEYVLVVMTDEPAKDVYRNHLELLAIQAAGHLENAILYEQIRTNNDRMQAILDSTRDGILLLDRQGNLIESNASAARLLGVSLDDYIGLNFAESLMEKLINHSSETVEGLKEMLRILRLEPERITNRSFSLVVDNQERFIHEVGSPVMDANGQIIGRLLTLRDVTEEKLLESYRDELSSMVVHDLRGPLGAIISSLNLAAEIADGLGDDTLPTLMDVSLENAQRLLHLVDSLLDVYRLETRRIPLTLQPTSLAVLVNEAYTALKPSILEANITLITEIPDTLPDVMVDRDQIRRVLVNLLDNALRFTPDSGTIGIYAEPRDNMIHVCVADSGPGIPAHETTRIFEKFRQIKGSRPARGSKGSGLGLSFCKLALEAHGGRIWVEPQSPLPGACFCFTLPLA
ncbi:MAG: GAF domain-containing protein [Chloroflexi bacterium]|nr:MAG: GAF domain-containing protein [Chloroflexota bacterium]